MSGWHRGGCPGDDVNKCSVVGAGFRFFLAERKMDCVFAMAAWGMSHLLCVAFAPLSSSVCQHETGVEARKLMWSLRKTWSSHCRGPKSFQSVSCLSSYIINSICVLWNRSLVSGVVFAPRPDTFFSLCTDKNQNMFNFMSHILCLAWQEIHR